MAFDIFNYKINLTPDIKFILETLKKMDKDILLVDI